MIRRILFLLIISLLFIGQASADDIPPTPLNLAQTNSSTGFWINYTWQTGSGNVTDSYNVSVNGTWTNGSSNNWSNGTVLPHGWRNISVYAFNSSGSGTLNQTPVSMNTQVSNNIPVISYISPTPDNASTNITGSILINTTVSDADGDNMTSLLNWNNSLVGWWRMNENTGGTLVQDFSGYGNNGTWNGNSTSNVTSGRFGNALRFDGVDDCVNVGDIDALNSVTIFTIEGWIKQTDNTAFERIFGKSKGDIDDVTVSSYNSALYFEIGNSENSYGYWLGYGSNISSGSWYHLAAVYNGSGSSNSDKLKIYINSSEKSLLFNATIPTTTSNLSGEPFYFGVFNKTSGDMFNGSIDESRIWNRALSQEEINASYDAGSYRLQQNFTGLSNGNYLYQAFVQDSNGAVNQTEIRTVTVGAEPAQVQVIWWE